MYDDARNAPKTAEDHEKDAYGSTCLTAAEARRILSAHKVPGRSKLDADAAAARSTSRQSPRKFLCLLSSPCHLYPKNGIFGSDLRKRLEIQPICETPRETPG